MNEDEKLLAYRKSHFQVTVTPSRYPQEEGEIMLSITHNGNQWQSMSLLVSEIELVLEALREAAG